MTQHLAHFVFLLEAGWARAFDSFDLRELEFWSSLVSFSRPFFWPLVLTLGLFFCCWCFGLSVLKALLVLFKVLSGSLLLLWSSRRVVVVSSSIDLMELVVVCMLLSGGLLLCAASFWFVDVSLVGSTELVLVLLLRVELKLSEFLFLDMFSPLNGLEKKKEEKS